MKITDNLLVELAPFERAPNWPLLQAPADTLDNVYIERLWRSVKYEDIYLKYYETVDELYQGLTSYFAFYAQERPHQALRFRTTYDVYHQLLESPR